MKGIDPDTSWFYVDGGLFNNARIRLAHQIADSVFSTKSVPCCSTAKKVEGEPTRPQADSFKYVYISAGNSLYPAMQKSTRWDSLSIWSTLLNGVMDWAAAARSRRAVHPLRQEHPKYAEWLLFSRNYYPVYSRLLFQQFGFLEKDLRIFDFYLGMYDAQKFLSGEALDSVKRVISPPTIIDPSFDKICHVLNGDSSTTCSTNLERLARVSRELFFWYWDGTRGGIAQKRQCAWEFAVAVRGLAHDVASWDKLNKVLKDALTQGCPEGNCHVDTSRLREMTKFILAISRHSGKSGRIVKFFS